MTMSFACLRVIEQVQLVLDTFSDNLMCWFVKELLDSSDRVPRLLTCRDKSCRS